MHTDILHELTAKHTHCWISTCIVNLTYCVSLFMIRILNVIYIGGATLLL